MWLNDSNQNLFHLDGYDFFNKNRPNNKIGGGVGIYVLNKYKVKLCDNMCVLNDSFESIFLELTCNYHSFKRVFIGCVYRPPGGDVSVFTEQLSNIFVNKKKFKAEIIMGDFNIDLIKSSSHVQSQEFIDMFASNSYTPAVTLPTRITGESSTLIDNFFVNCPLFDTASAIVYNDISDHFPILLKLELPKNNTTIIDQVHSHVFSEINFESCSTELGLMDWNCIIGQDCRNNDPDAAYNKFLDAYKRILKNHSKVRTMKLPKHRAPRQEWMTNGLANCCYNKSKLYKKFKCYPTIINENAFKIYRNKLKAILWQAERNFYTNKIIACAADQKQIWKILNYLISKKKNQQTDFSLDYNGQIITNPADIVDRFNNFFVNIGPDLASRIPPTDINFTKYLKGTYKNSFYLSPTNAQEVIQVASLLPNKKSKGVDEIPVSTVKQTISKIAEPLAEIINTSIHTGIFPDALKIAKICPIYKGGPKNEIGNYRPISVLPSFSKIFEKLVYKRLYNYITKLDILIPNQYGFRPSHSASMALLDLYDKLSENIENRKYVIGIFIDLQKAFDTVNHDILLKKLHHYGIRGIALKWFSNYLSDRTQYVSINNVSSDLKSICCGVPQGSILGPLLFLLYVNDLVNSSDLLYFILYADDTSIICADENLPQLISRVNDELQSLACWFKANKMSLNIKKTNFVMFGLKRYDLGQCCIKIDNHKLEQVDHVKFLGILVDVKLSWKNHIVKLSSDISKCIGVLTRVKFILPTSALLLLYNALILSRLSYCCLVWGWASKTTLDPILKIQKKAVRIISKKSFLAHSDILFFNLNILKIYDMCNLQTAIFVFNAIRVQNDLFLHRYYSRFKFVTFTKCYETRSNPSKLMVPFCRSSIRTNAINCKGASVWNLLPAEVQSCNSVYSFKKIYKIKLLSNYQDR